MNTCPPFQMRLEGILLNALLLKCEIAEFVKNINLCSIHIEIMKAKNDALPA
jgi:hypothetical protein